MTKFTKRIIKEYKDFLIKGNAIDLAIGFIFGWAFATVIKSLVDNVIMPPLGMLMHGVDFSDLFIALDGKSYATIEEVTKAAVPTIKYGQFGNDLLSFLILGFVVFFFVKMYNKLKKPEKKKINTHDCPHCLMEIPLLAKVCGHCTKTV